jgi:uncharacterized membrane protein YfcA
VLHAGLALIAIVALAFTIESALGFGATVVTVTLGAFFLPIDQLLPAFAPLNVALSLVILARTWRSVDRKLLFLRVLPLMVVGMPVGMVAMRVADGALLVRVYGVLIVVLAIVQLAKKIPPPPRIAGHVLLFCAGAIQGAFGTGGPLTVFVMGNDIADKTAFRATMSALWLGLNLVLIGGFVVDDKMSSDSLRMTLSLAVGLVVGLVLGELVHRRLDAAKFKVVVWAMLGVAGVALALR